MGSGRVTPIAKENRSNPKHARTLTRRRSYRAARPSSGTQTIGASDPSIEPQRMADEDRTGG
jgi:hypothetical protein